MSEDDIVKLLKNIPAGKDNVDNARQLIKAGIDPSSLSNVAQEGSLAVPESTRMRDKQELIERLYRQDMRDASKRADSVIQLRKASEGMIPEGLGAESSKRADDALLKSARKSRLMKILGKAAPAVGAVGAIADLESNRTGAPADTLEGRLERGEDLSPEQRERMRRIALGGYSE